MGRFDSLLLDPGIPVLAESLDGFVLGSIDPLYARYGRATAAETHDFEQSFSSIRSAQSRTLSELVRSLTGDGVRGLPKSTHRGDWPFVEKQIVRVLVDLIWVARLLDETGSTLNCEQTLAAFCREAGSLPALDRLLESPDLKIQGQSAMELVEAALRLVHKKVDGIHVDSEEWFQWEFKRHFKPPEPLDPQRVSRAAEKIADSLAAMSVCQGVLIEGSFAETDKRDGLNDLDLTCYCTQFPDLEMRNAFFKRLNLNQTGSKIPFEYLRLDEVHTHLCFVLIENQRDFIAQLATDGDESAATQFLHPKFATSPYHLTRSLILRDPNGLLATLRAKLATHPPALRDRIQQTSRVLWKRFEGRYRNAIDEKDRVNAFIALRFCTEATAHAVLTAHGLYCNPIELKWLPHELKSLQRDALYASNPALQTLGSDAVRLRATRFERLCELWNGF